ncbi:hypothetical protein DL89DRAFT_280755 [Linderina pennispora]|uniref:Uncharacterized protein n=1 Tax=Linderina pennispora TaxID=61395 RepID=A0A1Y1WL73_9FUNG|nr:uncharacterized protein DL89DRAFT_280755 [Linderina pennispora]ORX74319.1 hypothetical protein DL89DRAFT_280755 [Linderina pennispora]
MSPKHTQMPLAETHILDEDEFTERLDGIIERDFFPDLKQLRAENRALEIGADVAKPDVSDTKVSVSLGEFLDTYTSEDSASFKRLLQIENKSRNEPANEGVWTRQRHL